MFHQPSKYIFLVISTKIDPQSCCRNSSCCSSITNVRINLQPARRFTTDWTDRTQSRFLRWPSFPHFLYLHTDSYRWVRAINEKNHGNIDRFEKSYQNRIIDFFKWIPIFYDYLISIINIFFRFVIS